jgi:hypothetical protein
VDKIVCKTRNELERHILGFVAFQIIKGEGWLDRVFDAYTFKKIISMQLDNQSGKNEYLIYKELIRSGKFDKINDIIVKKKTYTSEHKRTRVGPRSGTDKNKGYMMNELNKMVENIDTLYYVNETQLKGYELFRKKEKKAEAEEERENREAERKFRRELKEELADE